MIFSCMDPLTITLCWAKKIIEMTALNNSDLVFPKLSLIMPKGPYRTSTKNATSDVIPTVTDVIEINL